MIPIIWIVELELLNQRVNFTPTSSNKPTPTTDTTALPTVIHAPQGVSASNDWRN